MRRARNLLVLIGFTLAICVAGAARGSQSVTRISGIGILDYSRKPTFKVGDYVRYAVTTRNQTGEPIDRYNLTVMIAGQEVWWGEPCFYIETSVDDGKTTQSTAATLMSYSIFDDSLPEDRLQMYMRKSVIGYDADLGKLNELLVTPKPGSLTSRSPLSQPHNVQRDTLGADTVQTPVGVLRAVKVVMRQSWGKTGGAGDSTVYKELHEERTQWICDQIPLTRYAREETTNRETRRAWFIGRSNDAPPAQSLAGGSITARLVAYGHGMKSAVLPDDRVHSFDESPAPVKRTPAARPKTAAGGARRR